MPITVVVGGQYGSEGKGKTAAHFAAKQTASAVVRCGGSNSGHTVYDPRGKKFLFRHLPTASVCSSCINVLVSGSYLDVRVLLEEIQAAGLSTEQLCIDPYAVIITTELKAREVNDGLVTRIGSTGSGTGAAVAQRVNRSSDTTFAKDVPELAPYLRDSKQFLHELLSKNARVIIEGTQGYGLSLLHSNHYPYVTARDTTAAGFLSECGLSPLDVDEVVLVLRAFPIRVAGDSGPLPAEISWERLSAESGIEDLIEYTSVTNKVRRVAHFNERIPLQAIMANRPSKIVLNHLDYVRPERRAAFVSKIETLLHCHIDLIGLSPRELIPRSELVACNMTPVNCEA